MNLRLESVISAIDALPLAADGRSKVTEVRTRKQGPRRRSSGLATCQRRRSGSELVGEFWQRTERSLDPDSAF
jgi:hypothetical protein